jgi:hypothetical protein
MSHWTRSQNIGRLRPPSFCLRLIRIEKQITTSRLDPSDHFVEHVAAGHASTVPQTILNALLKHVLGIQLRVYFAGGPKTKTYQ